LIAAAMIATSCRYNPVEQDIIDSLGEDTEPPGPNHRPGQPCLACHSAYGGATPFAVAGTVFALDETAPAINVEVEIFDSFDDTPKHPCSNSAGNFYIPATDWPSITYPLRPAGMRSLVGRDGSCATCHKLSGAGHDSTGRIVLSGPKCGELQ
jgi:hypothetical protein